ncbi:MAG: hypothetical protein ACRBB5_02040 [Nitrosopumilus sp.]
MKNYTYNPNLSSQEVRIHQLTTNQTIGTIQNVSKKHPRILASNEADYENSS